MTDACDAHGNRANRRGRGACKAELSDTVMIEPGKHYQLEVDFSVLTAAWDHEQSLIGAVG